MGIVNRILKMVYTLATILAAIMITMDIVYAQPVAQANDVRGFIHRLTGEWIGADEQYADGKKADTKYFHAVIKQLDQNTYQTIFEYYRLDKQTGAPIKVGESIMTTRMSPDGTAINQIVGEGEVLIDPNTSKPEQHNLSEVLRVSPVGGLDGRGSGRIKVSGMPLGMGKNGKVNNYHSIWIMNAEKLKISQDLNVKFKVLFFNKSFHFASVFIGNRGSDINGFMKSVENNGSGR